MKWKFTDAGTNAGTPHFVIFVSKASSSCKYGIVVSIRSLGTVNKLGFRYLKSEAASWIPNSWYWGNLFSIGTTAERFVKAPFYKSLRRSKDILVIIFRPLFHFAVKNVCTTFRSFRQEFAKCTVS